MKAFSGKQTVWNEETGYHVDVNHGGMDLRDYFAAKAMQGILESTQDEQWFFDITAKMSYEMADAMMKARDK